jgi:REP element-mobilizing transposase RayT
VRGDALDCRGVGALGYNDAVHKHLRRLERIYVDAPMYFVTSRTKNRRQLLARDEVANILIDEWRAAQERHGWAVGRYVIMPDHVHFFCRPELDAKTLSEFVGNWKSWTSRKIHALNLSRSTPATTTLWQREFSITFFVQAKAIPKSGIMSEMILSEPVWFLRQTIGRTRAKLKR